MYNRTPVWGDQYSWWLEMLSYSCVQIPTLHLLVVWLLEISIKSYIILVPALFPYITSTLLQTLKASMLICGQDKHAPTSGPLYMLPLPRKLIVQITIWNTTPFSPIFLRYHLFREIFLVILGEMIMIKTQLSIFLPCSMFLYSHFWDSILSEMFLFGCLLSAHISK